MKNFKKIALSCVVITLIFSSLVIVNAVSNRPVNQTDDFAELMSKNPFRDSNEKARSASKIYAKGDHIEITEEEFLWQVSVFELDGSSNPEEDAYKDLCRYKTLIYEAGKAGFSITDEELQEHIDYMVTFYEEYKKDGETDNLYETYGGAENYENMNKEVTRNSLLINKYLESFRESYYATLDDSLDEMEKQSKWLEEQKKLEQDLIQAENIEIIQ